MYLRTPKRYRPGHRERRVFNLRWLWLWLLTPIAVVVGMTLYNARTEITPPVQQFLETTINSVQGSVATANAPTPMPTDNPSSRLSRADQSWTSGAIGRAVEDYLAASSATPNMPQVFIRIALGSIIEGKVNDAVQAAENAVTADPYNAEAWAVRALALARTNKPLDGIASALEAISLNPSSPDALAFLAESYRQAGQVSLALETANRAIDADPNRYEGYYVRGLINYYNVGDFATARDDLANAANLAPNLPFITVEQAWLEWQFDNTDSSMEMLSSLIELDPNNLDALYALGYFYYQTYGNSDSSLEYLGRCLAADPQNIACLAYQAIVFSAVGRINDAMDTYRRLMSTGTTEPKYFLRAGGLFADAGDCNTALPWLRQGYELERTADSPNADRLTAFESYLTQCQPGFSGAAATPDVTSSP